MWKQIERYVFFPVLFPSDGTVCLSEGEGGNKGKGAGFYLSGGRGDGFWFGGGWLYVCL